MGFDKSTLVVKGQRVLTSLAELAFSMDLHAVISCGKDQEVTRELSYPIIHDSTPYKGPAAGLLSAMNAQNDYSWLCMACDMPFLDKSLLKTLLLKRNPSKLATVFCVSDGKTTRINPFPAIYECSFRSKLERSLQSGQWSLRKMIGSSDCEVVPIEYSKAFLNFNRPEDLII